MLFSSDKNSTSKISSWVLICFFRGPLRPRQVQLLKDRYDESVGQKNALMEESQMLQVRWFSPDYQSQHQTTSTESSRHLRSSQSRWGEKASPLFSSHEQLRHAYHKQPCSTARPKGARAQFRLHVFSPQSLRFRSGPPSPILPHPSEAHVVFPYTILDFNLMCVTIQDKLERADKLVSGLAGEFVRWQASIGTFEAMIERLIGDSLIAAAFLSYAGTFDTVYR